MRNVASLAIIGSYPPPYGGVAVHVQRLCALLDTRAVDYLVYNGTSDYGDGDRVVSMYRGRGWWLLRYLFTCKEPVVYLMSGRLAAWVIGALLASCRGKRVILRLRNASLQDWSARSWWRRALCRFVLRRMDGVICVNRSLMECAAQLGVATERLHWSPGFLPPATTEFDAANVHCDVLAFVAAHGPVIAANGRVRRYAGKDLYGLDMLVELAARLRPQFPNVGIVVCFWDYCGRDAARLEDLKQMAVRLGVSDNIMLNTHSGGFLPVLAKSDVFVRPTNTDGDANSVREALCLHLPTVASDVVERPAGALRFRSRDIDDFERQVRSALTLAGARQPCRKPVLSVEDHERVERYLALLERMAGRGEA